MVENGRQTYLAVEGDGYVVTEGDSYEWADSFCLQMTSGAAPHVAPDAQQVPLYRAAGVNDGLQIRGSRRRMERDVELPP